MEVYWTFSKILQPFGVPNVFDIENEYSESFEQCHQYGFGVSVFVEPFVNIAHGTPYYKLNNESTLLPDGLVLTKKFCEFVHIIVETKNEQFANKCFSRTQVKKLSYSVHTLICVSFVFIE